MRVTARIRQATVGSPPARGRLPSTNNRQVFPNRLWPAGGVSRLTRGDVLQLQRRQGNQFVLQLLDINEPKALVQRQSSDELGAATSAAERTHLEVLTGPQDTIPGGLLDAFTDEREPEVDDVKFGSDIPVKIRPGLKSVGAQLLIPDPAKVRYNVVTNVALNLKRLGGVDGVYRFTLIKHKTKPVRQLVVEQISATPPAELSKMALDKQQKRFDGFDFSFAGGSAGEDAKNQLLAALAHVPNSTLERVRGLTFILRLDVKGPPDEAGHYDPNNHSITLFAETLVKLSTSTDAGGASFFTHAVTHEIGHAIDFESRTQAERKLAAVENQLAAARTELDEARKNERLIETRVDPNMSLPTSEDEARQADEIKKGKAKVKLVQQKIAKLQNDRNAAVDAVNQASRSSASQDFTKAKGAAISRYGGTAQGEDFAELFAIYTLNPKLLHSIRPDAYEYFSAAERPPI